MKHRNELVQQMDTKGPFYLKGSQNKNYFIHTIDDCSRQVVGKWYNTRSSKEALSVLMSWIEIKGKPTTVMNDCSRDCCLYPRNSKVDNTNGIKGKQTSLGNPPMDKGSKVDAFNSIVKTEFLRVEELIDVKRMK
jgi:hypothetical protein